MVKISVIIPAYNVEKYIDKCLTSLVNQTLDSIEIIVVNDGSVDNTKNIIDKYKDNYPDIIKIINIKNSGIGPARNIGIKKATGKYITFIDSDDYIKEDALEIAYKEIEKSNSDIVVWDYYEVNESGHILKKDNIKSFNPTSVLDNKELLFNINPAPWNKLYKKELFNDIKFPNNRIKYEDLLTTPKVLLKATKITKIEQVLSYYLIRDNGETKTIDKRVFDILEVLDGLTTYLKKEKKYSSLEQEVEYLNIEHVMFHVVKQRYVKSKKMSNEFIYRAFAYLNTNFPNWKKNKYYKRHVRLYKRIIQENRLLLNIYFKIYKIFRR